MANRLKSKKSQASDSGKLKPEKETKVTAKQIVKDERTHKITGAFFLLVAVFLFIAFTSYLFTWKEDQSIVLRGWGLSDAKVANLLGHLGAWVSCKFFYFGFGLASYLFCSIFFIVGANLFFARKIFSASRNLRYVLAGLLFFSVSLSFITRGSGFSWGGAVGDIIRDRLINLLGWLGTAALLFVAGLAYFIWRFNPVFKVPKVPSLPLKGRQPVVVEEQAEGTGARLFVEEEFSYMQGNILKEEGGVVVISPKAESPKDPSLEMKMVEKEGYAGPEHGPGENPAFVPPMNGQGKNRKKGADREPELEIRPVGGKDGEKDGGIHGQGSTDGQDGIIGNGGIHGSGGIDGSGGIHGPGSIDGQGGIGELEGIDGQAGNAPWLAGPQPDYEPTLELRGYKYPPIDLLEVHGSEKIIQDASELETNKNQIINTLKNYDIAIQKISATVGPTVTLYEIVPAAGVRISRIKNLEDDIALSLAALGIRIIAPIPGKGTIGIEVPNVKKTVVSMRTLLASDKFRHSPFNLPIAIGKKIDNENFIVDLGTMPHLLMAGATGQGKSVGINAILVSLLYKKHPSELKLVLIDPKKVELSLYRVIEKYFLIKISDDEEAIITDTKKVIYTLNALCEEMDQRYNSLKEASCRNIREYNDKFIKRKLNPELGHKYLPFIVLVIDEFADLIMTAGKEIEMPIARLAQLARAVGIHLIIATQRPSVNIITGTIKANFPARIAFKVSSKIDSRTILDMGGAEQLIGKGDMLISYNGEITRLQCAFVDTPEVEKICEFISDQKGVIKPYELPKYEDEKEFKDKEFDKNERDELFDEAARLIVQNQIGSTSLLQRRMKLGYNRAGRLMDQLEAAGVVGPGQGSKPRDVLIRSEQELNNI